MVGSQPFCFNLGRILIEYSAELTVGGKLKSLEQLRILFGEVRPLFRAKHIGEPMFWDGESTKSLHQLLLIFLFVCLERFVCFLPCLEKVLILFVKTIRRIGYWCRGLLSTRDYWRQKQNQEYPKPGTQLSPHDSTTDQQPARFQEGPTMSV